MSKAKSSPVSQVAVCLRRAMKAQGTLVTDCREAVAAAIAENKTGKSVAKKYDAIIATHKALLTEAGDYIFKIFKAFLLCALSPESTVESFAKNAKGETELRGAGEVTSKREAEHAARQVREQLNMKSSGAKGRTKAGALVTITPAPKPDTTPSFDFAIWAARLPMILKNGEMRETLFARLAEAGYTFVPAKAEAEHEAVPVPVPSVGVEIARLAAIVQRDKKAAQPSA